MRRTFVLALFVVCCLPMISVTGGITRTWTGAVSQYVSEPHNWSPAGVPASDDSLIFDASGTVINDLPAGTAFGPMTFDGFVTLNGNPFTMTGNVTARTGLFLCNADVKIGAPITLAGVDVNAPRYGSVDVNGQALTVSGLLSVRSLNGTGAVTGGGGTMTFVQDGSFNGTISGVISISGSMPNANVVRRSDGVWPRVSGRGALGTVDAERIVLDGGTLRTKSMNIHSGAPDGVAEFDLNPSGASSQLQVTGTVTLENPVLLLLLEDSPVPGQHFRIIDNDGTEPVSGTFLGLPEGGAMSVDGSPFYVTYRGGDGNDVELIAATTPSADLTQGSATSVVGEPVALHVVVSSQSGIPAGTVTFVDNRFVILGTVPLENGSVTFNVSTLPVGSHNVTAFYSGDGSFFGSAASASLTHTVTKGESATNVEVVHTPVVFGAAEFRVLSAPVAPAAGTLAGAFELREGNKVLGGGKIDAGSGHVFLPALSVGTHTLSASYEGSENFHASDSAPFEVDIVEAPTEIQATYGSAASSDGTVLLNIIVTPLTSAPVTPTGTITISANGVTWSQEPITGSLNATFKLPGGHHSLSIGYSGDSNFLGSATELDVDVAAAPPARRRGVHH